MHRYPLTDGRQGQTDPGITGRRLDDRPARLQPAPPLGLLDHGHADAVLDATARIERLELQENPGRHSHPQSSQRDQGRTADRRQD